MVLEKRREIARRIDHRIGEHPQVTAVFVFGSVASGHVDERSDVDVMAICRLGILSLVTRKKILSPIGSNWQFNEPSTDDPIWAGNAMPDVIDNGVIDGTAVEVHYQTERLYSEVLGEIVGDGAITTKKVPVRPYTLAGLLQRAWLLRDKDGNFSKWLEKIKTYPRPLKMNILRHFVPILRENAASLKEYAERRLGPGLQIFFLSQATDAMASILYALNDTYDPADKRAERTILRILSYVPRDFVSRYAYVLEGPFDDSGALERARLFGELADEVLEIADVGIK